MVVIPLPTCRSSSMYGLEELLHRWPDLVITTLGVLLGALFALLIERSVANWSLTRQRAMERERERGMLLSYLERIELEVQDNIVTIMELQSQILVPTQIANLSAKKTLFRWGAKLVGSLSTIAFDDLVRSGLHSHLPKRAFKDLFDARQRTVNMRAIIEAAEPRIEFFATFSMDKHYADQVAKSNLDYSYSALDLLRKAQKSVLEQAGILRNLAKKQNGS